MRFPVIGVLALAAASQATASGTRDVNCDKESLPIALAESDAGDTLRVSGTCREPIVVAIDRIKLDGQGSAVFDGGVPGGTPFFGGGAFNAAIIVDGARGIIVRGFTIRNQPGGGIIVKNNASLNVQSTRIQENFFGVAIVESSHAGFENSEITGNTDAGLGVLDTSSVDFTGTVRINQNVEGISGGGRCNVQFSGELLEASGNKGNGIFLSGCNLAPSTVLGARKVVLNDNGADGLFIGGGQLVIGPFRTFGFAGAIYQQITAQNNKGSGINLAGFAQIVNLGGGKLDLQGNAVGLTLGIESSVLSVGGIHAENNGTGILANGAGTVTLAPNPPNPSVVQGNRDADIDLRFGTRSTLAGVSVSTPLKCDGTILSSGNVKCP
jgi:hypothetical protein